MQASFLERPLPSSEDSERAILGGILIDGSHMDVVAEQLRAEDFYSPLHRRIFSAMRVLFDASKPIDPILIGEELTKEGSLESIGGLSTITNLSYGLPFFSSLDFYIASVREHSQLRSIIRTGNHIAESALQTDSPAAEIIERAEKLILGLSLETNGDSDTEGNLEDALNESLEASERFDPTVLVPTGLGDLDRQLGGGLEPGNLIVIAARPSMGKTALATQIAIEAASKGKQTAIFSLEMARRQVTDRIIAGRARVNLQEFRTGTLSMFGKDEARRAAGEIAKLPLSIFDESSLTIARMRAKCRRILSRHRKLDLIILDYLQLLQGGTKVTDRRLEIESFSRGLKLMAKEFNIPVVALSQLSRAPEARKVPRPILSDLRESGSIEQDADVVLMLYRPEGEPAEIIVAKHRNGPTGTVHAVFHSAYARFESLAREHAAGGLY